VPTNLKGFGVAKKLKKIGNKSSDTAELFLEDVRVPEALPPRRGEHGVHVPHAELPDRALIAAVRAVAGGVPDEAHTMEYGRDRKAFGKPIIKREVWQHKFVDLYTKLEAAKAFVYESSTSYNDERYVKKVPLSMETVKLISMTKILVGDVASEVADTCLQFHGGWGYIEDFPIARTPGAISGCSASAAGRRRR
jgi:citronellyl-CoA dehydrogenase